MLEKAEKRVIACLRGGVGRRTMIVEHVENEPVSLVLLVCIFTSVEVKRLPWAVQWFFRMIGYGRGWQRGRWRGDGEDRRGAGPKLDADDARLGHDGKSAVECVGATECSDCAQGELAKGRVCLRWRDEDERGEMRKRRTT